MVLAVCIVLVIFSIIYSKVIFIDFFFLSCYICSQTICSLGQRVLKFSATLLPLPFIQTLGSERGFVCLCMI